MRYWKLIDSERVIRTGDIVMSPLRWIEITKEEFEKAREIIPLT